MIFLKELPIIDFSNMRGGKSENLKKKHNKIMKTRTEKKKKLYLTISRYHPFKKIKIINPIIFRPHRGVQNSTILPLHPLPLYPKKQNKKPKIPPP